MKNNIKVIITSACLLAAMLLASCGAAPEANESTNDRIISPSVSDEVSSTVTDITAKPSDTLLPVKAPEDYIDRITFLGDSTTYGLRHYEVLKGGKDTTMVWTPKSGTLSMYNLTAATIVYPETDEEITIKEALTRKQPEYLVITLGVNGIAGMNETQFKAAYKILIKTAREASPNTKIICHSMYPVASNYDKLGSINNEKISKGNKWIEAIAAEEGLKYVDTYSVLIGEDGWLPQSYQNGDGLHLTPEGFAVVLDNLRANPA